MLQLQGLKNNFWLLTADNAGALTVFVVLRGSTLRFDGSPLLYLIFYSNLSARGVRCVNRVKVNSRANLSVFRSTGSYIYIGPFLTTPHF